MLIFYASTSVIGKIVLTAVKLYIFFLYVMLQHCKRHFLTAVKCYLTFFWMTFVNVKMDTRNLPFLDNITHYSKTYMQGRYV